MERLAHALVDIITTRTLAETVTVSLRAYVDRLKPEAACLLLWDATLNRYIIGETWRDEHCSLQPPQIRRQALRLAAEHAGRHGAARHTDDALYVQPLDENGTHVGAFVGFGARCTAPPPSVLDLLTQAIANRLCTAQRLEHADAEHSELEAERGRLEELLKAVEQQQRTIDRLLAMERRFSASLEAEVETRTRELKMAQNHLIQSEKLAVIGQLASSLAHELNNPMQAIRSGLGLVIDELPDDTSPTIRQDLAIIVAELERMDTIFRQMLDFYRPVTLERLPLDLNAICEGVYVLLRKRLQQERVTLHLNLPEDHRRVCGDRNQIKQVLLNLILNAAEAMAETGGDVWLTCEDASDRVLLAVTDNGPGIASHAQSRLFEPLFTTKTRGLGLGLAISLEIVQRHGGDILVESTPGQGTTFTVCVPVEEDCNGEDTRGG